MNITTVLVVVLLVILLGGLVPWDRGAPPPVAGAPTPMSPWYSGYGYGWGIGGPIGLLLVIVLILAALGG